MAKLLIETATNRVVNRIADPTPEWQPPAGHHVEEDDGRDIWQQPAPRVLTPLEFRSRFTDAERYAVTMAAMSAPELRLWMDDLAAAVEVDLDDPRTVAGVQALVAASLLTETRAAAILA